MNSVAFARIERAFAQRPPLDLVACARCLSRAHAAHALDLGAKRVPLHAEAAHGRKVERVRGLDGFWSAVALQAAITDLLEEHPYAVRGSLAADLVRFGERQSWDVTDPAGANNPGFPLHALLPPRRYLPDTLPAALVEVFGGALDLAPCALAA